jgi:hypothetical protein
VLLSPAFLKHVMRLAFSASAGCAMGGSIPFAWAPIIVGALIADGCIEA